MLQGMQKLRMLMNMQYNSAESLSEQHGYKGGKMEEFHVRNFIQSEIGKLANEDPEVAEYINAGRLSEDEIWIREGQLGNYVLTPNGEYGEYKDRETNEDKIEYIVDSFHYETGTLVGDYNSGDNSNICPSGQVDGLLSNKKGVLTLAMNDAFDNVREWEKNIVANDRYN